MRRKSDLEYFSKTPPPPQESLTSILFLDCQGYESNTYNPIKYVYQFIGNEAVATFMIVVLQ